MKINEAEVKQQIAQLTAKGLTVEQAATEVKKQYRQQVLQQRSKQIPKPNPAEVLKRLENFALEKPTQHTKVRWYVPNLSFEDFLTYFKRLAASYHYSITNTPFVFKTSEKFNQILKALYQYITSPVWKGLFLFGGYGTGKTLTVKVLSQMLQATAYPKNFTPKLKTATEIIDDYLRSHQNQNEYIVNGLKYADLLIIDDLGAEEIDLVNWFGNKLRPIHSLIEYRYKRGRLTWFTSNYSLEELRQKYNDYIIDRLKQMCIFVKYSWQSYRE